MDSRDELPEGASPLDRPDRALEALLKERGLMHYSSALAIEGAMLQSMELLKDDIMAEVRASLARGGKPDITEGCEKWLHGIIERELEVFDERLIEAGLPPSSADEGES